MDMRKLCLSTLVFVLFGSLIFGQTPDDDIAGPNSGLIEFEQIGSTAKVEQSSDRLEVQLQGNIVPIDGPPDEPIDPPDLPPVNSSAPVGSTPGRFNVSATGGATYTVPIATPPGIKSVVPEISLNYNGQGGNGIAGYGWNIGGLSTITRVASTDFHDGEIDAIDFDTKDRYALDGQRLMLKSGTYGSNGSEYATEHYSNIKIKAYGTSPYGSAYGPSYFIVFYPDGSRAWYGNGGNSRSRLEWAIFRWQDAQDNRITYTYSVSNNLLRINNIKYGKRNSDYGINEIRFLYTNRTRPEQMYVGGQNFKQTHILNTIQVYGSGQLFRKYSLTHSATSLGYQRLAKITESNSAGESLNPLDFNYGETADNVIVSDGAEHEIYPGINYQNDLIVSGEFNGDGRMDFFTYNKNNKTKIYLYDRLFDSGWSGSLGWEINTGNFETIFGSNILSWNGKLLHEQGITKVNEVIAGNNSTVTFSTFAMAAYGPVHQYKKTWTAPTNYYENDCDSGTHRKIPKEYISGDFNGDGLTDVIAIQKPYTNRACDLNPCSPDRDPGEYPDDDIIRPIDDFDCCNCHTYTTSTPTAYYIDLNRQKTTNYVNYAGALTTNLSGSYRLSTADFNGDGRTDIILIKNENLYVYGYNTNTQRLELIVHQTDSYITLQKPFLTGDFNGDGKTDFITPVSHENWRHFISTGNNLNVFTKDIDVFYSPIDPMHYLAQDFNGDGKSDILVQLVATPLTTQFLSGAIRLYSNVSNLSDSTPKFTLTAQAFPDRYASFGIPIFLDANKQNGNLEYAYIDGKDIYTYEFTKDHREDVTLQSITNSNGVVTDIEYERLGLNDDPYGNIYSSSLSQPYPYINVNYAPSFKLVSKVTESGYGVSRNQEFKYKGAKSHAKGLGFQGFEAVARSNWYGNGVTPLWSTSMHNIQKRGAAEKQWTKEYYSGFTEPSSGFVNKTTTTYNTQLTGNKVFVNVPTSVTAEDGLTGVTKTASTTYDTFYNPLTVTSSTGGNSKSVTYTYSNNPASTSNTYHIGRVTKKQESATIDGNTFTAEIQFSYNNNLPALIKTKGHNTPFVNETLAYDGNGNITTRTLSGTGVPNRTERFTYSSDGRYLTKHTDVEGLFTTYTHHLATGNLLSETGPLGHTTTYTYDAWGRSLTDTDYLGKQTTYSYNRIANGQYTIQATINGGADLKSTYDAFDRLIEESADASTSSDWINTRYEYDAIDRRVRVSEPYFSSSSPTQWNETIFDSFGRTIEQRLYTGQNIIISYNGLSVTTDDGTKVTTTTSDAQGNIKSVTDPGGTVNYTYFGSGDLKTANYDGHTVTIQQDGWGRKTQLNDPAAGLYTYSYNLYGELLTQNNPNGSFTYTYDNYGKLTQKVISGSNMSDMAITYSYDPVSKLLKSVVGEDDDEQYIYNYTYDSYYRPVKETEDAAMASFEKHYTYDAY